MRKNMSYEGYEMEEFLSDEKFQDWVLRGEHRDFWTKWMLKHPEKREEVEEATLLLKNISLKKNRLPSELVDVRWTQLKQQIIAKGYSPKDRGAITRKWRLLDNRRWLRRAAAVSVLIITTVVGYQYWQPQEVEYLSHSTTFGEKKEIALPDGSTVRLNSNSKIEIPKHWDEVDRHVNVLFGEAYFDITKKPAAEQPQFVVRTEGMDITVLGTSFNVNNRHQKITVALVEGKVRLDTENKLSKSMIPGDVVSYSLDEGSLVSADEDINFYTSWLRNSITLDNISLGKIALLIEDHFGNEVHVNDEQLKRRKLTGSVSDGDVQIVIRAIESSLNVKATITQQQIILNPIE